MLLQSNFIACLYLHGFSTDPYLPTHRSTYFSNKVVLTQFICVRCMVWDLIWGTSSFYKLKIKKVKRGGKSAIRPNWFCRQSITVLSTPSSSMSAGVNTALTTVCPKRKIGGNYFDSCNLWKSPVDHENGVSLEDLYNWLADSHTV